MANRQERVVRAEQIIIADPNVSKRGLQAKIKSEFGVGLSDTTRRDLLQKANTPGVLRARLNTPAFTRYDRVVLRKIIHRSGNASYVIKAVNDRYTVAREMHQRGSSPREIHRAMLRQAKDEGYISTKTTRIKQKPDGMVRGQVDWWRFLRDLRHKDIGSGEYTRRPQPKKARTEKGKVIDQKARYQDKQATKAHERWVERERSRLQGWIEQKEKAIEITPRGDRRRQLVDQKANLERTLRSIR